jgi:hypothetical protein
LAPSILTHLLHNASAILLVFVPAYGQWLGIQDRAPTDHLPASLVLIACALVAVGILITRRAQK